MEHWVITTLVSTTARGEDKRGRTRLDCAVEGALKSGEEIHLASCRVFDKVGIHYDLVRLAEAKVYRVLLYQLPVLLGSFASHLGGV